MGGNAAQSSRVLVDGVGFDPLTMTQVVDRVAADLANHRGGVIITPNVDILRQLRRSQLQNLTDGAAIVVADGAPVIWASRLRGNPLPERVTGAQLVWTLSHAAAREGRSVFLLGAGPGVAERAADQFRRASPGLKVAGIHSPPWGFEGIQGEMEKIDDLLTQEDPDIVFVSIGALRQERLATRLALAHPGRWFLCCGAALDIVAGDVPRAHPAVQRLGVEWVHRLAHEPGRLARRYLIDDLPYASGMLFRSVLHRARSLSERTPSW